MTVSALIVWLIALALIAGLSFALGWQSCRLRMWYVARLPDRVPDGSSIFGFGYSEGAD